MVTFIEKIFRQNAEGTENSILVAQWEYDKKLVTEALKTVPLIFPHYSQHDESHSISILNNISNVLGKETIEKLGCTDLWLILETAYCHDLGMVITSDMIKEAFTNGSFLDYFKEISDDSSSPLHTYTTLFQIKDGKIHHISTELNFDVSDAVKYLLSGYLRSKHSDNSKRTLQNPIASLSMPIPHIIIPNRLYNILAEICRCHAKNFHEVMNLPYVENGLSLDTAHPRFIACLLRIGDVLDIDNNRFSETILRTLREVPYDSKLHHQKHRSISHIRIDNKHIEIAAKCANPQVAKLTKEWFDWINNEFKEQALLWNQIVPKSLSYYLPNVDETKIEIEGYIDINTNDSPQFSIDTGKALELLRGQNLYNDIYDSIREIIQNAVDSTLIRFYMEHGEDSDFPTGINASLIEKMKPYFIDITINKNTDGNYKFSIQDRGIGLKRSHLPFLSNTGSSSKNSEKNRIIERMPDWFRPSGTFGIGFQSVFLLTDCVNITTKDFFTDECYALEMYKPNSSMKGDIYIKKTGHLINPGLKIDFILNSEASINKLIRDPFHATDIDDVVSGIDDKIREYASLSLVPVRINGNLIERKETTYYDNETGIEFYVTVLDSIGSYPSTISGLYYRNAKVQNSGVEIKFLHPLINIHKAKAADILTIDRNNLQNNKLDELRLLSIKAIKNYIHSDAFNNNYDNSITQLRYFLFAKDYNLGNKALSKIGEINYELFIRINDTDKDIIKTPTAEDFKNATKVVFKTISRSALPLCTRNDSEIHLEGNTLPFFTNSFLSEFSELLMKILSERFDHCYLRSTLQINGFGGGEYVFTDNLNEYDVNLPLQAIKDNLMSVTATRLYYYYIPGFEDIVIPAKAKDSEDIPLYCRWHTPHYKVARILSPFLKINGRVKDAMNDEFYEYVSSLNGKSIDIVKETYDRFVKYCYDNDLII